MLAANTGTKQVSTVDVSAAVSAGADYVSLVVIDTTIDTQPNDRFHVSGQDGAEIEANLAKSAAADMVEISNAANVLTITAKDLNKVFDVIAYYELEGTTYKIDTTLTTPAVMTVGQPSDIKGLIDLCLAHEGKTSYIESYFPSPDYGTIAASSIIVMELESVSPAKDGSYVDRKNRTILYVADPNADTATTGAKAVLESADAFDDNTIFA